MKKSLFTLLLLPLTLWVFSQDVIFNVDDVCSLNGEEVAVPVRVTNFNNVLLFSQSIRISNGQVARFTATPISNVISGTKSINRVNDTLVTIAWGSSQPVNINDGNPIFILNIELIGTPNQSADIIIQNTPTDIEVIDGNGNALGHQEIQGSACVEEVMVNISGKIHLPDGRPINKVMVSLRTDTTLLEQQITAANGAYVFVDYEINRNYTIAVQKNPDTMSTGSGSGTGGSNTDVLNGVDGRDQLALLRHISGVEPFSTPLQAFAADVNGDGVINLLDGGEIFRLVGNGTNQFSSNISWLFIPSDEYDQLDFATALQSDFSGIRSYMPLDAEKIDQDFIGIKLGDLTNDVIVSASIEGPADEEICINGSDCSTSISVSAPVFEGCSDPASVDAAWVYVADSQYCGTSTNGTVTDASNGFTTPAFEPGVLTITFIAEDVCGNVAQNETVFTIIDCQAPTPSVLSVSVELNQPTNTIVVFASNFDAGSFDNCDSCSSSSDLIFSFSNDTSDISRTFGCLNLGTNNIEIWITDPSGNQSNFPTFIVVQNNVGSCTGTIVPNNTPPVTGKIVKTNRKLIKKTPKSIKGKSATTTPIPSKSRSLATAELKLTPFVINNGTISIDLVANGFQGVSGFQFSINWDTEHFSFTGINNFSASVDNLEGSFFLNNVTNGTLTCVWVSDAPINLDSQTVLTTISFDAFGEIGESDSIQITGNPTKLLVFDTDLNEIDVTVTHSFLEVISAANDLSKNHQLEIGPNPSNGLFKWKLDNKLLEPLELTIYDGLGRQIKTEKLAHSSFHSGTLDLSNYTQGVYWFSVRGKHTLFSKKLVLLR